jgi:hypothetical protein
MQSARLRTAGGLLVGALALGVGACGGGRDDYKNELRPPSPVVVTASVSKNAVSVSPRKLGAGPISLIVSNQTGASQQVTIESAAAPGSGPGIRQETAPINPRDTATLTANVAPGTYRVHVVGDGIRAATFRVGKKRASAQNDLLQP